MTADVPCRHTCDTRRSVPILAPLQVHDPATGETLASLSHCKGSETRAAIAEASSVFKSWAAKTGKERSQILRKYVPLGVWITGGWGGGRTSMQRGTLDPNARQRDSRGSRGSYCQSRDLHRVIRPPARWFELVRDNQEDITTLMTLECGKPLAQSKGEFESG